MILKISYTGKKKGDKEPPTLGWIWYDNVLTASCIFEQQYGCKVITLFIKNQVDPTTIQLREVAYLLNDEGKTIEAFYAEIPQERKDKEEKSCSMCIHSHKVEGDEYDKVYECDAEEYDIDTHSCFVPREEK